MALDDTLARLPAAAEGYARSLLDHHWLEASWQHERRDVLWTQGALLDGKGWRELEARTEAHVAALARGGTLVFDQCEDRAVDGDVGELATAIRLLARTGQPDAFNNLLERLDWQEPARAHAIADALTWDAPGDWQELVAAILGDENAPDDALGPLARVVGRRGWPLGDALLGVLEDRVGDLEAVAWALGALEFADALPELYELIQEPQPPAVRQAAALAAMRIDPREVLAFIEHVAPTQPWAVLPLAVAGGAGVHELLCRVVEAEPTPQGLRALGLHGAVGGLDRLLAVVEDDTLGEAAADGLFLLTGAPLHEETREDDLGAEPEAAPTERPGLLISRLPRERATWEAWLDDSGAALRERPSVRVRLGRPYVPEVNLELLESTTVGPSVRDLIVEELAIRDRLPLRAWSRLARRTVDAQIEQARQQLRARPTSAIGGWILAGQPQR